MSDYFVLVAMICAGLVLLIGGGGTALLITFVLSRIDRRREVRRLHRARRQAS